MMNIEQVGNQLKNRTTSSEKIIKDCFQRIHDKDGQGKRVFTDLYYDQAVSTAQAIDKSRAEGQPLPPYAGIPISVKDLFDIKGRATTAGSKLLKNAPPAMQDARIISNLKKAGFIILGSTNMTEFAYSGLGLNPHYGTPFNPYEREIGRIPGGSSSGAAISITDSFAAGAIGTDTGGSCRIPAALCGIVGFKPTQNRVSRHGTIPLSPSLDSVGPLAATVKSCAILDSVISEERYILKNGLPLKNLTFGIPREPMLDDMDEHVSKTFETILTTLSNAGVKIREISLSELMDIPHINKNGGIAAAEAYAWHRELLEKSFDEYDPRVSTRIVNWVGQTDDDYRDLIAARGQTIKNVTAKIRNFDALICPTIPTIAPTIKSLENDDEYLRQNMLMLRNPSLINFLDGCSISIPCHHPGEAPVGLMLSADHGEDQRLLAIAASVEKLLDKDAKTS